MKRTRSEAEIQRAICWFSCGAPSACAAKLAIEKYGREKTIVVYCDTLSSEHIDNERFKRDIEGWIGKEIMVIRSGAYASVDEVFEKERYMSGINGARCTTELKKVPRMKFQRPDDLHIFGMAADEQQRIKRLEGNNPELLLDWILVESGMTKAMCKDAISRAGIRLPEMYLLGFRNNNCKGCVKATSPEYWNRTRLNFPEVFERRARQSRELGVRLVRIKGERKFLDELLEDCQESFFENLSCGPECGT